MSIKKRILPLAILSTSALLLFFCLRNEKIEYIPTQYEEELIDYFKEIALQSEFDENPKKVIKWSKPMKLFVIKDEESKIQMLTIKKTIKEINQLATDGFKIELTNNYADSNSFLYLCNKNRISELNPEFFSILNEGIDNEIAGLAYSEFNIDTYIIDKSLIFINTEETINVQQSTILEEITQSLGLSFDSNKYPNSVFYQKKYEINEEINEYSSLDKDILRILYHPKIKPGIDSDELDRQIKNILICKSLNR